MNLRLAILLALLSTAAPASTPPGNWESKWDIEVHPGSCWLSVGYADNSEQVISGAKPGQFTIFDRFDLHFLVPVESARPLSPGYELGKVYLFLYSNKEPKLSEMQRRIEFVSINGLNLERIETRNESLEKIQRNFSLTAAESIEIFKALIDRRPVTLDFLLSSGNSKSISLPSRLTKHFAAWARMLSACAEGDVT